MINKIKILALVLAMISTNMLAQEVAKPAAKEAEKTRNDSDQMVYQMAMRYNDTNVAKVKLYELIERNPNNVRYSELLASLYFEMEQYASAALVAMDIVEGNKSNTTGLEIAAYSLEQLGALDRSLRHFESLYLISGDLFSLYKTAYLQYTLKKYDEAMNSVNMLAKNSKVDDQKLAFPTKDNEQQEVPMRAAALNLKGLIYKDQGSNAEAKKAFDEALLSEPNFEVVKENLAALK
jgi:predicted Zn-dependent protease